jgi:DNA polymerase-3 subunit beta
MTATATKTKPASGIKFLRTDLLAALQAVGKAISNRTPKPILRNVRIGEGRITATDLEVRIDRDISDECEPFLVPHDRLLSIVREARGDEITLKVKDTSVAVKCGGGSWTLPTEDVREFPAWEPEGLKFVCRMPAEQFHRAVNATVYATDNESSRYALGSVCIDVARESGEVNLIGTDGRRMSVAKVELGENQDPDSREVLVPSRAIGLVGDMAGGAGGIEIEATGSEVRFQLDGTTVTARLTEGRFPRWRDLMSEKKGKPNVLEISELKAATRAAAIVTSEQSKGIDLSWRDEMLMLSGKSSEYGESSVKCPLVSAGDSASVKLDPSYIVDFLDGIESKEGEPQVEFYVTDAASQVFLKCGDYLGIIMPLDPAGA